MSSNSVLRGRGTRARLAESALDLFESQGFDNTTIDQIVSVAGLSKTTFFRHFRTKEDVIFPDHEAGLTEIMTMLHISPHPDRLAAVYAAARHVLKRYIEEGELARRRYRLTRLVPALRNAEVASIQLYHRTFRQYLADNAQSVREQLLAEIQAASVVAATNFTIRRWLRNETVEPLAEFDQLTHQLAERELEIAGRMSGDAPARGRTRVVVLDSRAPFDDVVDQVRAAIRPNIRN